MKKEYLYEKSGISSLWLGSFFLVGLIGHLFNTTRPLMLKLTPWILLLIGMLVLLPDILKKNKALFIWVASAFGFTFFLEVSGVQWGIIFGSYAYGDVLGLKVFGVPLLIGFNWIVVVLGVHTLLKNTRFPFLLKVLLSAALCTFFDFLMEPVAINLGYWNWQGAVIPFKNYLSWFFIALICTIPLEKFKIESKSMLVGYYIIIQTVFFAGMLLIIQ